MRRLLPFVCGLLLSLLAVTAAAEPLSDARGALRKADQSLVAATARQARLRSTHERLVAQIRERKAGTEARLPGVGDGTLDGMLKRANDLSSQLEAADRDIARARQQVAARRAALLAAFDRALGVANQQVAERRGEARRAAFAYMQTLVADRARLVAAQRPDGVGRPSTVRLPAVADGASAEELRELADEASDNVERVRSQLDALEARLSALNTRRTMLRASSAMDGDLALFGEDERNRRIARADRPNVASGNDNSPAAQGDGGSERAADDDVDGDGLAGGRAPALPGEAPEAGAPPDADQGQDPGVDNGAQDLGEFEAVNPPSTGVAPGLRDVDGVGGAVVFEAALDPALLSADVEALSPGDLADQLAALRKKKAALRKAAADLAKRRAALEARAATLENE